MGVPPKEVSFGAVPTSRAKNFPQASVLSSGGRVTASKLMILSKLCRSQGDTMIKGDNAFLNSELAFLLLLILYKQKDYNFKKSTQRIGRFILLTYYKDTNSIFSFQHFTPSWQLYK